MSTTYEGFLSAFNIIDNDINSKIDQRTVADLLKEKISPDTELTLEESAEIIAFTLVDQFKGSEMGFGNYFGPQIVWMGDDGKQYHSPSLNQITHEVLTYWEKRIGEVKHPFLISRYSGLVWDLSQIVTGQTAGHELRKKFISVSIEIIQKRLYKDSLTGSFLLERTLDIASKFNDKEFYSDIKILTSELQAEYDAMDYPRYCFFSFDIFTAFKKLDASEEEITDRIKKMEEWLTRLCTVDENKKTDPWAAEVIAGRLADFYLKKNDKEELKRVILMVGQAYEPIFVNASNFQIAGWLQTIYKLYRHYALNEEAERIAARLREVSKKTHEEMGVFSHKFDVPKDKVDEMVNSVYTGTTEEIFAHIIGYMLPDKEELKESLLTFAKKAPMQFMFSTQLQDRNGRPVANIGSIENDIEGHLILRISEKLKFDAFFLHFILEGGVERAFLNVKSIIDFLSKSAIVTENRLRIIEKGLEYYFAGDYLSFTHLIIPQIEEAIRNLIEGNGGNSQKFKNGVFNLRTFDDILRDPIVETVMGVDSQTYFKIVFTDARGWNLRNEVCHGMVEFELFDKQTADRILHTLLCLGMIRMRKNGE